MPLKTAIKKDRKQQKDFHARLITENGRLTRELEAVIDRGNQLLEHKKKQDAKLEALTSELELLKGKLGLPNRRHLPDTRPGITHKFSVGGHEGYMTVGLFEDGEPGELFVTMAKEGSTVGGLMDTIGRLTSIALQYGVTIEELAPKFFHQRFEPSGWTTNPEIKEAASIIDYVFHWLHLTFVQSKKA